MYPALRKGRHHRKGSKVRASVSETRLPQVMARRKEGSEQEVRRLRRGPAGLAMIQSRSPWGPRSQTCPKSFQAFKDSDHYMRRSPWDGRWKGSRAARCTVSPQSARPWCLDWRRFRWEIHGARRLIALSEPAGLFLKAQPCSRGTETRLGQELPAPPSAGLGGWEAARELPPRHGNTKSVLVRPCQGLCRVAGARHRAGSQPMALCFAWYKQLRVGSSPPGGLPWWEP